MNRVTMEQDPIIEQCFKNQAFQKKMNKILEKMLTCYGVYSVAEAITNGLRFYFNCTPFEKGMMQAICAHNFCIIALGFVFLFSFLRIQIGRDLL